MKCQSCSEEISQKFAHSLAINTCPFCGGQIMSEDLQVALSELREIMKFTEQFKVEIFDWLKTNYGLVDSNSEEYKALEDKAKSMPVKVKIQSKDIQLDESGNQLTGTPLQNQEMTSVFAKRAGIKSASQDHIKNIVNQIKKGRTNDNSMFDGGTDFSEADPADVAAYQEIMSGGLASPKSAINESNFGDGDVEPLPPVVEAMVRGTGNTAAEYNARDVAKLEALQYKSKSASKELSQSGGVGLIRRS